MMGFIRQIQLDINVNGELTSYLSDGSRDKLAISFSVSKTMSSSPNESTIVLKNLAPATRFALMSPDNKVKASIYVGYQQDKAMTLLATGDVLRAMSVRNGVENCTTLSIMDGVGGIQLGIINQTFAGGTPKKSVITALATAFNNVVDVNGNKINNIVVNPARIEVSGSLDSRGIVASGRIAGQLDHLARQWGFTWSIQDGIFQAINDVPSTTSAFDIYKISYKDKTLFKAAPELGNQYQRQTGMNIEALLNPKVKAGDRIDLESEFYPQYNGRYLVQTIDFRGDTWGIDWAMCIQTLGIAGQGVG